MIRNQQPTFTESAIDSTTSDEEARIREQEEKEWELEKLALGAVEIAETRDESDHPEESNEISQRSSTEKVAIEVDMADAGNLEYGTMRSDVIIIDE